MEPNEMMEKAKELYLMLLISDPQYPLEIYRDSICILGGVIRGEADPHTISYPLFCPMDDGLCGMAYAISWMKQAIFENMILNCFPKDIFSMLPQNQSDAPANFCRDVLTHAAARILLKKDPFGIVLNEGQADAVYQRFYTLGEEKSLAFLADAGNKLCKALQLNQPEGEAKIKALINTIYDRCMTEEKEKVFPFVLPMDDPQKKLFCNA
ncbi:MAG: hypothetical protein IKV45_01765 [Firmicutes bacterium]|nr:hypothetical protein [Bacillota bacterium]